MKKMILVVLLTLIVIGLLAQTDFEKFQQQKQQTFDNFKTETKKAEANYYAKQDSLFIQYKEQIEKLWNEFKESTPTEWVSYNSDFSGRSKVNFENSKIDVAAVVEVPKDDSPEEKAKQEKKAKEIVKEQLKALLKEKDKVTKTTILENQVKIPAKKDETPKAITPQNLDEIAEQIVKTAGKELIVNKDGKKNIKYNISLEMMPNNIKIRAQKYKPLIEKFCKKHKIDPKIAMAIIHTESFYNPKAYNRHGNAYGMMQIVPKYAGINMNNYLFKKNKKPTSKQLFNPATNLEMGIAYMRWLADNKWQKVTNKTNQYYCIICSYNGGPGTIYKAMTGKMNKIGQKKWDKMMSDLSNWDSERLYKRLRKKVPWAETRKYIKLVLDRMEKYYGDI